MNKIEIFGDPGDFSGHFHDDGQHAGHILKPCPFCGSADDLRIVNTHTASFWVDCECGAEFHGPYNAFAGISKTSAEALKQFEEAMQNTVDDWNTRNGKS
ncbi:TPA: hypothetical protein JG832_002447 [Enterobacter hormaechei subsp. xiangfangensis]|nr:hypothetical protein [Enterobacter hormaechei subsp. xiangfangensis]HAV1890583.1 hypothetical protein [Enterobacter hormaechei subsp. xiangfangensis]